MEPLLIWTDGSCVNNGTPSASCGIGVFYSIGSPRNISTALPEGRQTNNRAELCAILYALCTNYGSQDITIVTDSYYSIACITEYHRKWKVNGWKTSQGKSVEWRRIIEYIHMLITSRAEMGGSTLFKHVRGHSGSIENEQADQLARRAVLSGNVCNVVRFLEKRCSVPFS